MVSVLLRAVIDNSLCSLIIITVEPVVTRNVIEVHQVRCAVKVHNTLSSCFIGRLDQTGDEICICIVTVCHRDLVSDFITVVRSESSAYCDLVIIYRHSAVVADILIIDLACIVADINLKAVLTVICEPCINDLTYVCDVIS